MTTARAQAAVNAGLAASLASIVAWLGPPGTDLAAHVYQLDVFVRHGFELWTNYWYAGRYTFVGYSLLYYPLAALVGIKLLAVLSAATATAAFTLIVRQTWGEQTLWATRLFAVVTAASVLTAAFPYGLGLAFSLAALLALARGRVVLFAIFVGLTLAASPLAFVFLLLFLAAVGLARVERTVTKPVVVVVVAVACAAAALSWRLFPDSGRFPFPSAELIAALLFCAGGFALTWRLERARILRGLFGAYAVLCLAAYIVPSDVGANVARLRFAAIPIAALTLSLRRWRPWPVAVVAFVLACSWNLSPLAWGLARSSSDPSEAAAFWQPAIGFLHHSLTPGYRVEAVDTAGHWEAVYLTRAGIPIVRGWFRQDDFPQNALLYDGPGPRSYLKWLHRLGVKYVVLTSAPDDYSARKERLLLSSGRSGLQVVFKTPTTTVYAVPSPVSIITGQHSPRVVALTQTRIDLAVNAPGHYRLAVRYSPYFATSRGCLAKTDDGMTRLDVKRAGRVRVEFAVTPKRALAALAGSSSTCDER